MAKPESYSPSRPVRQPHLVSWRSGSDGRCVVRNRQTGESFTLGEEEHFLLEQIDGVRDGGEIRTAFARHFGQPLSADELREFVQLAGNRGVLPPRGGDLADTDPETAGPIELSPVDHRSGAVQPRSLGNRLMSGSLYGAAGCISWAAQLLGGVASRIDRLRLKHFDFAPRPDDVFIVTYPRSGTTWMQMILYQLTTDGRMDFPHIAEYCPWFEKSTRSRCGFEERPSPRLFKSHLPYGIVPHGPCKYIYIARDGKDVAVSYYHLERTHNGFEGSFDEFFERFLAGKVPFGSWFEHVKGWWDHRHDPGVLFLTYEALSRDVEACIRRTAAFVGREIPAAQLRRVVERSSFAFMKEHEDRFDPARELLWEQGVLMESFLRNGRVGDGAVSLTAEQRTRFDARFGERLERLGISMG